MEQFVKDLERINATTCTCTFSGEGQNYTFLMPGKFRRMQPGDVMIADTTNGVKVVILREIHDRPRLIKNLRKDQYRWVFSTISPADQQLLEDLERITQG